MIINTRDFGPMEIQDKDVIRFPNGLFAFEEEKEFVLIEKEDCLPKWLQSVRGENPRFILFKPDDIMEGYNPVLPQDALSALHMEPQESPLLFVIAVVPENIRQMTLNLKSPVAVNVKKGLAAQIILEKGNYPVRYFVFDGDGRV